jgi:protein-tyrosine phosphatase
MAEYVLQDMVNKAGLAHKVSVDSVGISSEEVGNTVHSGTVGVLRKHNVAHDALRSARQITTRDIQECDYLLAMDRGHLGYLERHAVKGNATVELFLKEALDAGSVTYDEVPDPWYDGQYDRTYDLVTKGCTAFLNRLQTERNL